MPHLTLTGQTLTSQSILNFGITDLLVHATQNGAVLYSTSGPSGGVAAFAIGPGGLSLIDFAHFTPAVSRDVMDRLALIDTINGPRLVVAGDGDGALTAFAIDAVGMIGAQSQLTGLLGANATVLDVNQTGNAMLFLANPGSGSIQGYAINPGNPAAPLQRQFTLADTAALYADSVFALESVTLGASSFLVGASVTEQGVTAYRMTGTGLVPTGNLGVNEGIGIMTPTAMATAMVGGRCFVLVGSAPGSGGGQSGAITVMQLTNTGALVAVDHVIDTRDTRFGMLQSLEVVEANGFTYVLAGGGDDGLTLFVLLPNGRLQMLDVMADSASSGLENVTSIAAMAAGNGVQVFVSSEISGGITTLGIDTSANGAMLLATAAGGPMSGSGLNDILVGGAGNDTLAGGGGDDILEDGGGSDRLTGGAGRDIFVLRSDGAVDRIDDFEPGRDRLDLSGWPFLYDAAQVTVQPTATGAIVTWRAETLVIETLQGVTMTTAQVRAAIIAGADRSPIQLAGILDPNEVLSGTEGNDVLDGGDGDDTLRGEGGNDTLIGGTGADVLLGGAGNDSLDGGAGNDRLDGGDRNDRLVGGDGQDTLLGGAGGDILEGGLGDDSLSGGAGDDRLWGGAGNDTLRGDEGDDRLFGGSDRDQLWGGAGNDSLDGGTQNDSLSGEAGDDTLLGGDGFDSLDGGDGNDMLIGGAGNDRLIGGAGDDRLDGGDRNDRLVGGEGQDTLLGGAGGDILEGGQGDDSLSGGAGDDRIWGGSGNDTLLGDEGNDRLFGGADRDMIMGGAGNDRLDGGTQNDSLSGEAGNDTLLGGGGFDMLDGGVGNDSLSGGDGNDSLEGGAGNDRLDGGQRHDRLSGGEGQDTLLGGEGNDWLTGGADRDVFVFADGHGRDTISDFDARDPLERIDLSRITALSGFFDFADFATTGAVSAVAGGVLIDTGGNSILLQGVDLADLDNSDFIF